MTAPIISREELLGLLEKHVDGVRHYLHLQIGKPLSKDLISAPEIALDNLRRELAEAIPAPAQGALDRKGAAAAAEAICDYTDNNLTMMDACDMDTRKAKELLDAAKRLRDMLAGTLPSTGLPAPAPHGQAGRVPDREAFWLVERMGTGLYVKTGPGDLTDNVWQAHRFANEREAFDYARLSDAPWARDLRATEHLFINKTDATLPRNLNIADAWPVFKAWLDGYAEEERDFSRYRDNVILDGIMTADQRRAISAALSPRPTSTKSGDGK